jgi:hypothetical protein
VRSDISVFIEIEYNLCFDIRYITKVKEERRKKERKKKKHMLGCKNKTKNAKKNPLYFTKHTTYNIHHLAPKLNFKNISKKYKKKLALFYYFSIYLSL